MSTRAALTPKEIEVFALVREHLTNAEIAERLYVSVRTVESHVSALLRKVGVADRRTLARASLPATAPVARTASLPAPLTSFVGRVAEREALATAVRAHRLVTAAGPGGIGKTRLAIEVAGALAAELPDGVVFVDLVKVTDPAQVGAAFADAADVPDGSSTPRDELLLAALGSWQGLVVVDNCEHVQDAARVWIERLLAACPSLRVLATSRVRLMLPFEHVVVMPGLSLVSEGAASDDATTLFVERMVAAGADAPTADELQAIGEICAALDGMALGIELAAARVPGIGLPALAGALSARLDLLEIGSRVHERHRSLRAAIDWSYDLLGEPERAVLQALSMFAVSADVAAVGAVSGLPSVTVLDALAGLVDWNLASRLAGTPARYRVLETIRQYAVEVVERDGAAGRLRRAHSAWCTGRLVALRSDGRADDEWWAEVVAVLDDARAALAGAAGEEPEADVAAMAALLGDVLFRSGHPGEAQQRYEEAAARTADPAGRCALLRIAAGTAAARNVGAEAVDLLLASAAIAAAAGDDPGAARDLAAAAALQLRASGIMRRPIDLADVDALLVDARARAGRDAHAGAALLVATGWRAGALARDEEHTAAALASAEAVGDRLLLDEALDQLTAVAVEAGDLDAAAAVTDRRIAVLASVPLDALSSFEHYDALHMACHLKLAVGRLDEAREHADALALLPCFRDQGHIALARRLEVDALAGRFDAALADAARFERDWRRAGRPVAANLAIGAYAARTVHAMVGDDDGAAGWSAITRALVPMASRFEGPDVLWRWTLDALAALHRGEIDAAVAAADVVNLAEARENPNQHLWLPWFVAAWAEAGVLAGLDDAGGRVAEAAGSTLGNAVAATVIERAAALLDGADPTAFVARFEVLGCPYQAARTVALAAR